MVGYDDAGTGADGLLPPRILAVDWGGDRSLLEAGSGRVGVAVDQADEVGAVPLLRAANHESDRLARCDAEPVRVAHQIHPRAPSTSVRTLASARCRETRLPSTGPDGATRRLAGA